MKKITFRRINFTGIFLFCLLTCSMIYISSCKKTDTPDNPYDNVNYNTGGSDSEPALDPISIQGLHKNIFSKKCALSGCHDGTFEPDFRTVQSSYASMVYHTVIKNTVDEIDTFYLRVIPFDHNASFLYERITTSTTEYMPSNGVRLPQSDINNIAAWIDNGAKDENGNVPVKPNLQPNIQGYIATDPTFSAIRYDTSRVGGIFINPFIIPSNTSFNILYVATDTLDGLDATPIGGFTNCKIKFSLNKDDFSSAITNNSIYNGIGFQFWYNTINSSAWSSGTTVYFRIYINDGDHLTDAEFPRNESPDYYKTLYAFYVQ
jgi:hypothetical protein